MLDLCVDYQSENLILHCIEIIYYIKIIHKYYINLERSKNRRQFMEETYKNIKRIEAYDGSKLHHYTDIVLPKNSNENNNGDENALNI